MCTAGILGGEEGQVAEHVLKTAKSPVWLRGQQGESKGGEDVEVEAAGWARWTHRALRNIGKTGSQTGKESRRRVLGSEVTWHDLRVMLYRLSEAAVLRSAWLGVGVGGNGEEQR